MLRPRATSISRVSKSAVAHSDSQIVCIVCVVSMVVSSFLQRTTELTLSSPGFFGSSQPGGGGGAQSAPHHNFLLSGE